MIAIHQNKKIFDHSGLWTNSWITYCEENKLLYKIVDCYQFNIFEQLKDCNYLLWHFSGYLYQDMMMARDVLYCAKKMGLKVFPDFNEAWHFDDKVAEMYALKSVNAPIPKSYVFYDLESFRKWLTHDSKLPVVGKLKSGSGSHNVKLIKTNSNLKKYGRRMLNKGYNPAPSLIYKTSSNVRSSHDWSTITAKAKRIPEFLKNLSNAKKFPNEKGYVYLQEFVPNEGYDLKVVVIGDKLSGFVRPVRTHDFRASGGGEAFFDKKFFTKDIIKSAFETTDALKMQCIGYDYVIDSQTKEGLIVEMSYGFSNPYVLSSGGYFDREYNWHEEPLNAPEEILKNLLK